MSYQYRAVEKFWRNFYRLSPLQKESVRRAWQKFKSDPFHPALASHEIHELSAKARHTIYSAVIETDLRVIFRVDGSWVTTLDVGTPHPFLSSSPTDEVAVATALCPLTCDL